MKLISGSTILVVLASFQLSPIPVSADDPDECAAPLCLVDRLTCSKVSEAVFPFKLVLRNEPCQLKPGMNGNEIVVCCKTEKGVELHKSLLVLKNRARALQGASPNEYPHQVQFKTGSSCGGTIYNKDWIITAGHCVRQNDEIVVEDDGSFVNYGEKQQAYVIAGQSHVANATEDDKYYIDKIIRHDDWNPHDPAAGHDISLLHLSRPLKLEIGKIQPIRLEPVDYVPNYGGYGYLVGYGNVNEKLGFGSDDLMEFMTPIHSNGKAFSMSFDTMAGHGRYAKPTNMHLSVGGGDSGVTVGKGDSGGPFICADKNRKPILCGIASFKSCEPFKMCRRPNIYQRVAPLISWIKNKTGNARQESELLFDKTMFATQIPQPEVPGYLVRIGEEKKTCTGTLLTPKLIVTSAECIMANGGRENYSPVIYHYKSGTYDEHPYTSVMFKDKFERNVSQNISRDLQQPFHNWDVAFVLLKTPIKTDELAQLPPNGYGITGESKEYTFNDKSNFVESRDFVPVGEEDCKKRFSGLDSNLKLNDQHLCMRQVYSPEAVCERDVGGPLICEGKYFCGFKSFHACKHPGVPEVFSSALGGYVRSKIEYGLQQG